MLNIEGGDDWPPFGHTMVGHKRMRNVKMALKTVFENNIPGDFVELGVWRGGVCIYAKAMIDIFDQNNREVHVFDAFAKLPGYNRAGNFLMNSAEDVKHNFAKDGVMDERVVFHVGLFKDTLPDFSKKEPPRPIAVLRVDGNFYDSYQDAMYYLYERVPVGGIVIFDDVMSHGAVMQFWKDFKREQDVQEELIRIDRHSAWFKKENVTHLNWDKFHPPKDANK